MMAAENLVFIHELTEPHFNELARILSDRETARWLGDGRPWTRKRLQDLRTFSARDATLPWATRDYFYWAIVRGAEVVGMVGFHPSLPQLAPAGSIQIMYAIAPDMRGQGIAGRAIRAAIALAHDNGLSRDIIAVIRADNEASLRAIARSGAFERGRVHTLKSVAYVVFREKIVY